MPLLTVKNLSKRYGSVRALDDVSIDFEPGEIHAVLGENGAGKSTLMAILSGFTAPDSGTVEFKGSPLPLGRPFETRHRGIAMVHQHFTLVPAFTVAENLALAGLDSLYRPIDAKKQATEGIALAKNLGWELDPSRKVGSLSVGMQQRVEIVKALVAASEVLILDEPTAVLTPDEVLELFNVIRRLKEEEKCVILIAHKLSEVMQIADRATVLRRGEWIATESRSNFDESRLATWMVGQLPVLPERAPMKTSSGLVVENLWVSGDRGEEAVRGVSFEVAKGEIVGIGGVDGNGQVELAEALAGIRGEFSPITWQGGPPTMEVAYIPQDRQIDGLALEMSVFDNMVLAGEKRAEFQSGPFLKVGALKAWASGVAQKFSVRVENLDLPVGSLSGGNQQKVVVGRVLDHLPDVLVAVNPTRGLDVAATNFVHRRILDARNAGVAVVLLTTDTDELFALSDRAFFISRGELNAASGAEAYLGGG